jgi:hypothetical protein
MKPISDKKQYIGMKPLIQLKVKLLNCLKNDKEAALLMQPFFI